MKANQEQTEELEEWLLLEQAILSDQVPPDALAHIFAEQLAFARWYKLRAESRATQRASEMKYWYPPGVMRS
jgi:hypothetical protein